MADVRLTATNPEDSSVVPVACTAAGLLRVEPQVQGPPGEDGDKGDKGDKGDPGDPGQDGQDGDPFSGNFSGNVTFTSGIVEINGGRFEFNKPDDFWSVGSDYIDFNSITSICSQGSYAISMTAGGYRNSENKWTKTSPDVENLDGASQVTCFPSGSVTLSSESVKEDGASQVVAVRLLILDDQIEVRGHLQATEISVRKSGGGYAQLVVLPDGTVTSSDIAQFDLKEPEM